MQSKARDDGFCKDNLETDNFSSHWSVNCYYLLFSIYHCFVFYREFTGKNKNLTSSTKTSTYRTSLRVAFPNTRDTIDHIFRNLCYFSATLFLSEGIVICMKQ